MITKASIRRLLWRHYYNLHYMIYRDKYNEEEIRELLDFIEKADRTNNNPKHIKNNEKDFSNNDGLRADDSSTGRED